MMPADWLGAQIGDGAGREAGAIAPLWLQHHLPYGLHSSFTPEVWWPRSAA